MTFSRTPALDQLVQGWSSYCEDVDLACDEILSSRQDIVLNRSRNAIVGAIGEAAMGQYVYDGIDQGQIGVPTLKQPARFLIGYETEPLLAVTIADKERGIVREYDGIVCVDGTVTILECKVIDTVGNIFRGRRGRQKGDGHAQRMRRNETKLAHLARRYGSITHILEDLTGDHDIAMIYFIPCDAYAQASARHGLLQEIECGHGAYFVPFQHDSVAFRRGAKRIQQHAKHARWVKRYSQKYPTLYK